MVPKSLSPCAILALRRNAIERYGGDPTERESDKECIDRSIGAALQGAYYLGEGGAVDSLHVASLLLYYFVKNHCFLDGNKRTGWMVAVD
jgi:death-on-curing protein